MCLATPQIIIIAKPFFPIARGALRVAITGYSIKQLAKGTPYGTQESRILWRLIMQAKIKRTQARLSLRASKEELARWHKEAKETGFKTTASYCRERLNAGMLNDPLQRHPHLLSELRETKQELSRIGNNLNQIARKLNAGEGVSKVHSNMDQSLHLMEKLDNLLYALRPSRK